MKELSLLMVLSLTALPLVSPAPVRAGGDSAEDGCVYALGHQTELEAEGVTFITATGAS